MDVQSTTSCTGVLLVREWETDVFISGKFRVEVRIESAVGLLFNEYRFRQSIHTKDSGHRTMNNSQSLQYEFEYMVQQGFGEPGFNDCLQIDNNHLPLLVARTSYCVTQSLFSNKALAKDVKKRRKDEKNGRNTMMPVLPVTKRSFIRSTFRATWLASTNVRLAKERRIVQELSNRRREIARLSGRK